MDNPRLTERTAVEQLPLYLHRSYALLRELDEQITGTFLPSSPPEHDSKVSDTSRHVTGRYNELLPTFQRYIRLRRSLASRQNSVAVKVQSPQPESEEIKPVGDATEDSKEALDTSEPVPGECTLKRAPPRFQYRRNTSWHHTRHLATSRLANGGGCARFSRKGRPSASRLRLSTCPIQLAPPPQSVDAPPFKIDRHIRLLDQSIREQEMSISFGLRQGTHPSLLPDLAAPSRWARATRATHSPIPGLSDDEDLTAPGISAGTEVTIGMATGNEANRGPTSSSKKGKKSKKRKTDRAVVEAEVAPGPSPPATQSVKIKVRPLSSTTQGDAAADPNEPKYCYCNRVSYGNVRLRFLCDSKYRFDLTSSQMVACDYPHCEREWVGVLVAQSLATLTTSPLTVSPRLRRFDGGAAITDVVLPRLRASCAEGRVYGLKTEREISRCEPP